MLSRDRLAEISGQLARRPGHETVRAVVYQLLTEGLDIPGQDIQFERPLPEVRGRADALLGDTVFEFKRDLRKERADAEEELRRYLGEVERQNQRRACGIATDGATFHAYELRRGRLEQLGSFQVDGAQPTGLLEWLDAAVAVRSNIEPTSERVRDELGRNSLAYARARAELEDCWRAVEDRPDVRIRRELWADLLAHVYGSAVDDDDLFFQHTFLTIVAKAMATLALTGTIPSGRDLLAGRSFYEAGIGGAVESDFFDWVLDAPEGEALVERIARSVARFRLTDVSVDVLKGLYESLIHREQRHDLGEYYTPDWLAAWMCEKAIRDPLNERVLDPACGSGTFLFHAVRRFLEAADRAGLPNHDALSQLTRRVLGIDVHPVAVIIARVTYLLAIGHERLRDRPRLAVPIYLGDALQWNTRGFLAERDVLIAVPGGNESLLFPFSVTRDPDRFDRVIDAMLSMSAQGADAQAFARFLAREGIGDAEDQRTLGDTYRTLCTLEQSGRDHIWGYVARNQSRPIWLSTEAERADVIIGNPPWLSYRFMGRQMKARFREECQRLGLWSGGRMATHQDLSAYFFVRSVELYLRPGGVIAFVMPYATLSRRQYEGFRSGRYFASARHGPTGNPVTTRFTEVWAFPPRVGPLFPVPSCVLFARAGESGPLPSSLTSFAGTLPRRDASPTEAQSALQRAEEPWPPVGGDGVSPYRARFRQGATIVPRFLALVSPSTGALGADPQAPRVESRRSAQEKPPWRGLAPLSGQVERRFVRRLFLGESVAPFRLLEPALAVIPWDDEAGGLLDADGALQAGYPLVARWLREAEALWREHGRSKMSLQQQLDYYGKLSAQFPIPPVRVVYAASGTLPAAAVLRDTSAVVDCELYWAPAEGDEARYLEAILNSETARSQVAARQSRGQWGARHFHKVMLDLPIPAFDGSAQLHRHLAALAEAAEGVASAVELPPGLSFVRARQLIRQAVWESGVGGQINAAVAELFGLSARQLRAAEEAVKYAT
jgi:hypothetical protein